MDVGRYLKIDERIGNPVMPLIIVGVHGTSEFLSPVGELNCDVRVKRKARQNDDRQMPVVEVNEKQNCHREALENRRPQIQLRWENTHEQMIKDASTSFVKRMTYNAVPTKGQVINEV